MRISDWSSDVCSSELMIFLQRCGNSVHEHILNSMNEFADKIMPEFKAREAARQAAKEAELAPYIAAALARRGPIPVMDDADTPTVTAFGTTIAEGKGGHGTATPPASGAPTHQTPRAVPR